MNDVIHKIFKTFWFFAVLGFIFLCALGVGLVGLIIYGICHLVSWLF